jgi:hypothetical protein
MSAGGGAQGQGGAQMKGDTKGGAQTKGQAQTTGAGGADAKAGAEGKADMKAGADSKAKADSKTKADSKAKADTKANADKSKAQSTTGQGGQDRQQGQMDRSSPRERSQQGTQERSRQGAQERSQQRDQGAQDRSNQRSQDTARGRAGDAGGSVNLTSEQKTKIRTTVLRSGPKVSKTNINFNISVGTVIPRSVKLVAVPATLVEIRPAWRGYMYFIVDEEIIIVEPRTHKIVAVLVV